MQRSTATFDLQQQLRRFKAEVFQALAHPTRIHVVEALAVGTRSVSDLAHEVGVEQANLSQHLAVLRSKGIVVSRKEGNQVHYSLRDPLLAEVLASMKQVFQNHLEESLEMLRTMESEA